MAPRLLWRGKMVTEQQLPLHGIAFVAHFFPSTFQSPRPTLSSHNSPFDDPFSCVSSRMGSGSDMCLGLEMMRGANLKMSGRVKVRHQREEAGGSADIVTGRGENVVLVETPTDVRVYLDPRCHNTVEWFETCFCTQENIGTGIKVDAGGDELILFASVDSSRRNASTSAASIFLLLGRASQIKTRKPRPDDPMPRENLFINKLRRTASLPSGVFQNGPGLFSKSQSRPSLTRPNPSLSLIKEDSGSRFLTKESKTKPAKTRVNSAIGTSSFLRPLPTLASRGPSEPAVYTRTKRRKVLPPSDNDDDEGEFYPMPGSPTPSVATTYGGGGMDEDEMGDTLADLSEMMPRGGIRPRGKMARSSSAPAGVFALKGEGPKALDQGGVENRNKSVVKKFLLAGLASRGIGRSHELFGDTWSITNRGIRFALRESFKAVFVDQAVVTNLVERHLDMYLPVTPSTDAAEGDIRMADASTFVPKTYGGRSEDETLPPSPRSLEAYG